MPTPCSTLITADDVEACCEIDQYDENSPPSDELLATAVEVASYVGWALGGRQHGICTVTAERPVRENLRCRCIYACSCACRPAPTVLLGYGPVVAVSEVRIGGVVVPSTGYRLTGATKLQRVSTDHMLWPACQAADEPDDAAGVLVVDYTWGVPLDPAGVRALGALGCEIMKACAGDTSCRLPSSVQSVVRQGVSIEVLDPFDFLEDGRTGLYEFDLWLAVANPYKVAEAPSVWSPDLPDPVVGR